MNSVNSVHRRHWKLTVIRTLSAEGYHVATLRRTIGDRAFSELLDQAFRSLPTAPLEGAKMIRTRLEKNYGELLDHPVAPYSRT